MSNTNPNDQPRGAGDPSWTVRRLVFPAALTGLWGVFLARAIWTTNVFVSRDMLEVSWPLRAFWRQSLLDGRWPAWFPGEALGEPYSALGISSPFHPLGLLALTLDVGHGLKWMTLVGLLAGLGGTFLLCRTAGARELGALLGAGAFGFSGYVLGMTSSNQPYLLAAAAIPWALWASLRVREGVSHARLLGAVFASAMVLFAGDFQAYLVAVGAMAAAVLVGAGWRTRLPAAFLLALLCVAGGSVQWLPGMLAGPGSVHLGRMTTEQAEWNSLHPLQLLDTFFGPVYGGRFEDDVSVFLAETLFGSGLKSIWVQSTYLGPVVLGLAIAGAWRAPARAWLLAAAALLLALALGRHVGLYGALRVLPAWNAFRYPMKLFPFLGLLLAVSAALGLGRAMDEPVVARRLARGWLVAAGATGVVLTLEASSGLFSGLLLRLAGGSPPELLASRLAGGLVSTSIRVGLVSLAAAAVTSAWVRPGLRGAFLLLVAMVDLYAANVPTIEVVPRDAVREPVTATAIRRNLPADPLRRPRLATAVEQLVLQRDGAHDAPAAFARARVTALTNASQSLWGLETDGMHLPLGAWWLWRLQQDTQWWVLTGHRLYSVGFLLASDAVVAAMGALAPPALVHFPEHGLHLLVQDALPRAYLARRSCQQDDAAVWARLHAPEFPVGLEAAVACDRSTPEPSPQGTIRALRWEPELIELAVDSTGGELVLNEAWHRGWTALLDGAPIALDRVNLVVRGVQVPPGPHRVLLRFATPGLAWGAMVSACTILGLLAAHLSRRRTTRRPGPVPAGP